MSTMLVAKKDFEDALQERTLWALTAVIVIVTSILAYSLVSFDLFSIFWPWFLTFFSGAQLQTLEFVQFYLGPAMIVIPLMALIISHKSLVGEIESGTMNFLFSVPLSRWHIYSGKFVGRTLVLAVALTLALIITWMFVLILGEDIVFSSFFMVLLASIMMGTAYVSLGFFVSAISNTQSRAVVYITAIYVFFQVVLGWTNNLINYFVHGSLFLPRVDSGGAGGGPADAPGWYHFIPHISPENAFQRIVLAAQGVEPKHAPVFPEGEPYYLGPSFMVLILIFWIAVPLVAGYIWFNRMDISK